MLDLTDLLINADGSINKKNIKWYKFYLPKAGIHNWVIPLEEAKQKLMWGTYGLPPRDGKVKWVRLIECSTEHLSAILLTQPQITAITREVIYSILNDRKMAPELNSLIGGNT
jgi:hypothetical protein